MQPKFDADAYFAKGGRPVVGHANAGGVPVSLEERRGQTRHRQDSGNSKMAADYGYIDTSRPDHDGMKTDAFVGPHKDSKKVFVVNQQHPRTGKFNEHKVLLGYNDRAHALRDYVHSFSDGLGHKRIHSVVEMGTHELKDWLKKDHTKPLEKAKGGPITDPNDPNQWLQFGGQDMETVPAGLPIGQAVGTDVAYQTAEGLVDAAKLAQEVQAGEIDPTSDEGIRRALGAAMVAQTGGVGGAPARAGETVLGSGMVRKAAEAAAPSRELSPMGLYSHGAESAFSLPQAKGTPEQMAAMLQKAGVKPAEMEGFGEAFAGRPSVTREEAAQFFKERMPQVDETVLRDRQFKDVNEAQAAHDAALERGDTVAAERISRDWESQFQGNTKFGQYTLPGGENYREVLLKLPEGYGAPQQALDDLAAARQRFKAIEKKYNDELEAGLTGEMSMSYDDFDKLTREHDIAAARVKNFEKLANQPAFQSGHWQDPNVLAHMRMSDRTGPNGEKILHVEEIQSDWGQKGKKEGFKIPLTPELENSANSIIENKLQPGAEFMNPSWRTPDGKIDRRAIGPSYVEFLEKNGTISSEEAKTLQNWNKARGFDASGVPTAPYVTSTQGWTDLALKRALKEAAEGGYDKLVWTPGAEQAKRYDLSKQISNLEYVPSDNHLKAYDASGRQVVNELGVSPEKISDYVGKDVASKLLSEENAVKFGGETGFHRLSGLDLQTGGEGMKGYYDKIVPAQLQKLLKKLDPEAKVGMTDVMLPPKGGIGHNNPPLEAPGITITPTMRENILKGMPHMAEGGAVEPPASDPVEPEDEQVNYAEGGEVAPPAPQQFNLDQKVDETVQDVVSLSEDGDIDQRKLAFLLRKASTGTMPADVSYEFAGEIMSHDTPALINRFGRYPRSIRVLTRVDAALGGSAGKSFGALANEENRAGFAKGGKVARKPYTGGKEAFEQFSDFALQNYGGQVGQNMINRAGGDAAKLMFAMAQYTKNLVAQDPEHAALHQRRIQQLGQMAHANKIDPRAAFNRTPDTMDTRKELQDILKGDHQINPAFKAALERMDKLVGSQ